MVEKKDIGEGGYLMVEIILAIAIMAVVIVLGAQMIYLSGRSNKTSIEKNVGQGLLEESLEAAQAVGVEKWQNLYNPPDGTGDASSSKGIANHYYLTSTSSKWSVVLGNESESINSLTYTRYSYIENVSRDPSTKQLETTYNSSHDDPSTQKLTVVVSWPNASPLSSYEYLTRWRNKICVQSNWVSGLSSGVKSCPTSFYESQDGNIDTTVSGSIKLKSN